MAVEYTSAPLKVAPAAAASISVAVATTAWANSAWTQIVAATTEAWILAGITIDSAVATEFEIDVGYGASGSEVVIATFPGNFDSTGVGGPNVIMVPIPISGIGSGVRVAVRIRKASTNATAWRAKLMYWAASAFGANAIVTAKPLKCLPSAAAGVSVSPSGTSWGNSSYGQISASLATAIQIVGIVMNAANANPHEIDISTGASGSETVRTTVRTNLDSAAGGPDVNYVQPPLKGIAAASRVAVRFRKNGTNATAVTFKMMYYEETV